MPEPQVSGLVDAMNPETQYLEPWPKCVACGCLRPPHALVLHTAPEMPNRPPLWHMCADADLCLRLSKRRRTRATR